MISFADASDEVAQLGYDYQWENLGQEIGWTRAPRGFTMIKVEATKIQLTEIALKQKGFCERQVWKTAGS